MFDAWVKVFLIFMGGPLFMMFGGLAVLLWGTWPTKARNGNSLKYRTVECGNSCSEGNVAKPRPSISINQLAISINQLACSKENTYIVQLYAHTHIYTHKSSKNNCMNLYSSMVYCGIILYYNALCFLQP